MIQGEYDMENNSLYQTTAIIDIDEEMRKQEELLNTIKMEPILETIEIPEEETIVKKKKRIRFTDYCLLSMIIVLSVVFVMVVLKIY